MYKIQHSLNQYSIQFGNSNIPLDLGNRDYQQFIQDVAEQGIEIVEGPDIIEPDYAALRSQEYPSREDQLDMMYWDKVNGTTVWEDTIQAIKDKYPKTITGGTTIGEVPDWVQEAADNWTFNKQLREYVAAVERLEHYVLSEGLPEIREDVVIRTEQVWNQRTEEFEEVNVTSNVLVQSGIDPLPATVMQYDPETGEEVAIRNPLIIKDEEERAAAQAIIDATPQSVIDSINS